MFIVTRMEAAALLHYQAGAPACNAAPELPLTGLQLFQRLLRGLRRASQEPVVGVIRIRQLLGELPPDARECLLGLRAGRTCVRQDGRTNILHKRRFAGIFMT